MIEFFSLNSSFAASVGTTFLEDEVFGVDEDRDEAESVREDFVMDDRGVLIDVRLVEGHGRDLGHRRAPR